MFSFCIWRIAWLIGGTHKDTRYRYRVAFAEHRHKLHKLHFHVQTPDGSSPALPSRLISIIVKITAQCTSMADARWPSGYRFLEWHPHSRLLLSASLLCPRASVLHPVNHLSIQPSVGSIVVYAQEGPERKWNKKHTHRKCLGRRADGISHPVGLFIVSGVEFGGMFKQRNELVDKHHYGYLASTLDSHRPSPLPPPTATISTATACLSPKLPPPIPPRQNLLSHHIYRVFGEETILGGPVFELDLVI